MINIIPAILAKDFKELAFQVRKIEPFTEWVHLDVIDGKLAPNFTWNNPSEWKKLGSFLKLEVHLMIKEPWKAIEDWIQGGAQRVIVHREAFKDEELEKIEEIIKRGHQEKREVGLALNPETVVERLVELPLIKNLDLVLFMAVQPGFQGQGFIEETLSKVKYFRSFHPHLNLGVDGGINPETAKKSVRAGANILVSGSFIVKSQDVESAIVSLRS